MTARSDRKTGRDSWLLLAAPAGHAVGIGGSAQFTNSIGGNVLTNLRDIVDSVYGRVSSRGRPLQFPMLTLASAQEMPVPGIKAIQIRKTGLRVLHKTEIVDASDNVSEYDMTEICDLAEIITELAFAESAYDDVKAHPKFRLLYGVTNRHFGYIKAGTSSQILLPGAPCMLCGLVLPVDNLTVDHQRPQTGGGLEAILKVFRALGLTVEGPQGPKGTNFLAQVGRLSPGRLRAVQTRPNRAALGGPSLANRYTLNADGRMLYSFIKYAKKLPELRSQCMHNLLNLKPACQTCNSRRGKELKDFG